MDNYLLWIWAGIGIVGWLILRRHPDKFIFDNPITTTFVMVLMAFGAPLWGGPVFLAIVLLLPSRQLCPHCHRAIPKPEITCPHCHRSVELLPSEQLRISKDFEREAAELAALGRKYTKWDLLALPLFFLFCAAFSVAWWFILFQVSEWRFQFVGEYVYRLVPPAMIWLLPAMFLGILSSAPPIDGLYRLVLGKNYREYNEFQKRKWPVNLNKSAARLFVILIAGVLLVITLMLDCYVLARSDKIVINGLWSLGEKHYSYQEIQTIRSAMKLKNAEWDHPIYAIKFIDGDRWSTRWEDRDAGELKQFIEFISRQSGLPIESVPGFTDSDV